MRGTAAGPTEKDIQKPREIAFFSISISIILGAPTVWS